MLLMLGAVADASAQIPGAIRRLPNMGRGGMGRGGGGDSLQRRDRSDDSLQISFRYLDSTQVSRFDSTLSDFTLRFPIPATHTYLGNTGTAAQSYLFSPRMQAGWDAGFHAYDVYKWTPETVRFFNTSRPYTELGYLLGSQSQQILEVLHTQNIKPYWNASLRYRLINSPGFFQNQKTNHNNYLLSSWYESPNRRYNNYFVVVANKLQSGENGGILSPRYLNIDSSIYDDRMNIPTKIGGTSRFIRDFFNSNISTGNRYTELSLLMRQQYDLGKKDSLVTDSLVIPLFYPRLRFENTLRYESNKYRFFDVVQADSTYFQQFYRLYHATDSLSVQDRWRHFSSDFSLYQFPDAKNLHQFLKLGMEFQLLSGQVKSDDVTLYNVIAHGEYRNRTRNKKWDLQAFGRLHLSGYNAGDYHAYGSLSRFISPRIGSLQMGAENTNRSPSFTYDDRSSFYLDNPAKDFQKENTLHFFGALNIPRLKLRLGGDYFLISNYLYLTNFYQLQQESALFNVLRLNASKTFRLSRRWRLYSDVYVQQKTGNVQLNMPLLFTRNRLAFEGIFFRNLNLSTGLEVRYHTPYKADDYSPVLGRFFYQDGYRISNLPFVDAFLHFRIRSFKAYVRAENLNTLEPGGFTNNNLAAPEYPYPGLVIRFGFYWSFVN